jgi:hypothetical protein
VEVSINSGCDEIVYPLLAYDVPESMAGYIQPNEFTYININLKREPYETYEIIPSSQNPDTHKKWPPLPKPQA